MILTANIFARNESKVVDYLEVGCFAALFFLLFSYRLLLLNKQFTFYGITSWFERPASLKISGEFPVRLLNMERVGVYKRKISG
jgi:hypothetical protein